MQFKIRTGKTIEKYIFYNKIKEGKNNCVNIMEDFAWI